MFDVPCDLRGRIDLYFDPHGHHPGHREKNLAALRERVEVVAVVVPMSAPLLGGTRTVRSCRSGFPRL